MHVFYHCPLQGLLYMCLPPGSSRHFLLSHYLHLCPPQTYRSHGSQQDAVCHLHSGHPHVQPSHLLSKEQGGPSSFLQNHALVLRLTRCLSPRRGTLNYQYLVFLLKYSSDTMNFTFKCIQCSGFLLTCLQLYNHHHCQI